MKKGKMGAKAKRHISRSRPITAPEGRRPSPCRPDVRYSMRIALPFSAGRARRCHPSVTNPPHSAFTRIHMRSSPPAISIQLHQLLAACFAPFSLYFSVSLSLFTVAQHHPFAFGSRRISINSMVTSWVYGQVRQGVL